MAGVYGGIMEDRERYAALCWIVKAHSSVIAVVAFMSFSVH